MNRDDHLIFENLLRRYNIDLVIGSIVILKDKIDQIPGYWELPVLIPTVFSGKSGVLIRRKYDWMSLSASRNYVVELGDEYYDVPPYLIDWNKTREANRKFKPEDSRDALDLLDI